MANYEGNNYTGFQGVNLKNTAFMRVGASGSGVMGTFSIESTEGVGRAYKFPNKSGTFPIMGTFSVQLPAAVAAEFSTIVTVAGIRTEDALVVQLNGTNTSGTTYGFDNSTGYIITQSIPGNGNMTLHFQNPGNATGYIDLRGSYLAMR